MFGQVVCVVAVIGVALFEVWTRCRLGQRLMGARMCPQSLYLRQTRVTIDPSLYGHIIPINDDLRMIRHASGRVAYLPVPRPPRARPPMPHALRALLLTFFTV